MTQFKIDDEPPEGGEARAQRLQTIMPWIWGVVGVFVVAAFVALMAIHPQPKKPQLLAEPAASAPPVTENESKTGSGKTVP